MRTQVEILSCQEKRVFQAKAHAFNLIDWPCNFENLCWYHLKQFGKGGI